MRERARAHGGAVAGYRAMRTPMNGGVAQGRVELDAQLLTRAVEDVIPHRLSLGQKLGGEEVLRQQVRIRFLRARGKQSCESTGVGRHWVAKDGRPCSIARTLHWV